MVLDKDAKAKANSSQGCTENEDGSASVRVSIGDCGLVCDVKGRQIGSRECAVSNVRQTPRKRASQSIGEDGGGDGQSDRATRAAQEVSVRCDDRPLNLRRVCLQCHECWLEDLAGAASYKKQEEADPAYVQIPVCHNE